MLVFIFHNIDSCVLIVKLNNVKLVEQYLIIKDLLVNNSLNIKIAKNVDIVNNLNAKKQNASKEIKILAKRLIIAIINVMDLKTKKFVLNVQNAYKYNILILI